VTICDRGSGQDHVTIIIFNFFIIHLKLKVMFNFLLCRAVNMAIKYLVSPIYYILFTIQYNCNLIGGSLQSSEVHFEAGQSLRFSNSVTYFKGVLKCVTKCD